MIDTAQSLTSVYQKWKKLMDDLLIFAVKVNLSEQEEDCF